MIKKFKVSKINVIRKSHSLFSLTILKIKNQDMKSSAYLSNEVVVKEIFYSLLQGFPLKKLIVAVLSPFSASDVFNQQ